MIFLLKIEIVHFLSPSPAILRSPTDERCEIGLSLRGRFGDKHWGHMNNFPSHNIENHWIVRLTDNEKEFTAKLESFGGVILLLNQKALRLVDKNFWRTVLFKLKVTYTLAFIVNHRCEKIFQS